jgi:hypothetical protein
MVIINLNIQERALIIYIFTNILMKVQNLLFLLYNTKEIVHNKFGLIEYFSV